MHIHRNGLYISISICVLIFPTNIIKVTIQTFHENARRSSDSTKYGTNKSSGASVTSGKHAKTAHQTYGAHESVSNNGKPPMHPNHHHNLCTNHKPSTTMTTTTTTTSTSTTSSIPVHNSNINKTGLYNNNVYRTSPYAYNVNCYDDSGYLESRPLSSSSFYGDGQRVSRGTKSDIGVPCRRPSASKVQSNNNACSTQYGRIHENRLPSVKSDFLLSYLNNNHNDAHSRATNGPAPSAHRHDRRAHSVRDRYANDKSERATAMTTAYHISGVAGSNASDMFKSDHKYTMSTASGTRLEHSDPIRNSPSHKINEQQRNRIINFLNRSANDSSADAKSAANAAIDLDGYRHAANVVGPLLYVDPTSEIQPSNNTTCSNSRDKQSHPFQAVSK